MKDLKSTWRYRLIGLVTAGLLAMAAVALGLQHESSETVRSLASGTVPGTVGTVTTASARQQVAVKQPGDFKSSTFDPPVSPELPGIIGEGGCGDSRVPLIRHTNGWSAAGRRAGSYLGVTVCAGAYRGNPNSGYLLVVRTRFPAATTRFSEAFVNRSGAVTITDAPLGEEGSNHVWDAHIQFEGELGTKGYLDLSDDSIHITQGPTACPPDASGTPPNCGQPELGTPKVSPKIRVLEPRGSTTFSTTVRNEGEANAWQVRVCAKVPRRFVLGKGGSCHRVYKLEPGETTKGAFRFRLKDTARPGTRLPIWFKLTSFGTKPTYVKALIAVRLP